MTADNGEHRGHKDEEQDSSSVLVPGWLVRPLLVTAMLSIPGSVTWFWRLESRSTSMDTRITALEATTSEDHLKAEKSREDIAQMKTDVAVIRTLLETLKEERRLASPTTSPR